MFGKTKVNINLKALCLDLLNKAKENRRNYMIEKHKYLEDEEVMKIFQNADAPFTISDNGSLSRPMKKEDK